MNLLTYPQVNVKQIFIKLKGKSTVIVSDFNILLSITNRVSAQLIRIWKILV